MSENTKTPKQLTKIEGLSGRKLVEQMEQSLGGGERLVLDLPPGRYPLTEPLDIGDLYGMMQKLPGSYIRKVTDEPGDSEQNRQG